MDPPPAPPGVEAAARRGRGGSMTEALVQALSCRLATPLASLVSLSEPESALPVPTRRRARVGRKALSSGHVNLNGVVPVVAGGASKADR